MNEKSKERLKKIGIFLLGIIVTYAIVEIIDFIRERPDIDVIMPTKIENGYLPIIFDNVGDKTLTNIRIKIKSCDVDFNKTYYVNGELIEGQKGKVDFDEEKTIEQFNKLPCHDIMKINLTNYTMWVETYKHNKTNRVVFPYQKFVVDQCMYCYWDIYFYSDQLNKQFREETYSTGQMIYEFGEKGVDLPKEYKPFEKIGVTTYDDRIVEAYS